VSIASDTLGSLLLAPLLVGSVVALAWGGWWALLALVALPRPRGAAALTRPWRIAVIVPAHDEAPTIAPGLLSLADASRAFARQHGEAEVVVVADNCSDDTAAVARRHGATVIERVDPARRGKGYALEHTIAALAARESPPDAVVFVDADTVVADNLFEAVAARLESGAQAVQVHYEAAPGSSSLARLRRLAFLLIHWSRPLGASRLGLGVGLKGNGMAMRWELASAGLGSIGIAEDAAMTLALARRGVAVAYEPRTTVHGYMAGDYRGARVQDERWEGGRLALARGALAAALHAAVRGRFAAAAASLELAAPPLSLLLAGSAAGLVGGVALGGAWLAVAVAAPLALASYVVLGLIAARAPLADIWALRAAPRFVLHKLAILGRLALGRGAKGWERTEREAPHDA
jgi:hypothetical protein